MRLFRIILLMVIIESHILRPALAQDSWNFLYPTSAGSYNYYDNINISWTSNVEKAVLSIYDFSCTANKPLDACLLLTHQLDQQGSWLMAINSVIGSVIPAFPFVLLFISEPSSSGDSNMYSGPPCTITSMNTPATTWGLIATMVNGATIQPILSPTIIAHPGAASTTEQWVAASTTEEPTPTTEYYTPWSILVFSSLPLASLSSSSTPSRLAPLSISTSIAVLPTVSTAPSTLGSSSIFKLASTSNLPLTTLSEHLATTGQTTDMPVHTTTALHSTTATQIMPPLATASQAPAKHQKRNMTIAILAILSIPALALLSWILARSRRAWNSARKSQVLYKPDSPFSPPKMSLDLNCGELEGQNSCCELDGKIVSMPRTPRSAGSVGTAASPLSGLEIWTTYFTRQRSQSTTSRYSERDTVRPVTSQSAKQRKAEIERPQNFF